MPRRNLMQVSLHTPWLGAANVNGCHKPLFSGCEKAVLGF